SQTLDYKASPSLCRDSQRISELCKDVTALANAAGGQLIYGIEEVGGKPKRVDTGVVDTKINREWIVQTPNSRIQPRMIGYSVERIKLQTGGFAFVITVPQTQNGPHQSDDKKYYRRFELQSVPMHDYEVRDVMARATTPQPFVTLSLPREKYSVDHQPGEELSKPFPLTATIGNRSSAPAMYAQIKIGIDHDFGLFQFPDWEQMNP